jgi:predicted porin
VKKKLIAIAVAGALTPALATAASTVQLYGKITYEYAIRDQGSTFLKTDAADAPGGSAIGFKGEEKLGGGLSAWFQCESSADTRGQDGVAGRGFCTRNSAIGFKGGFGNLWFGKWDTPFKKVLNVGSVGATETGSLGASFLAFGGSGGADVTTNGNNRARWKRREMSMTNFESKMGNTTIMAGMSAGDNALDAATGSRKQRVTSFGLAQKLGAFDLAVGHEIHTDFGGVGLDDKATGFGVSTNLGKAKIGFTYLDASYQTAAGQKTTRTSWTLGANAPLSGPWSVEGQYSVANDGKGNGAAIQNNSRQGFQVGANTGGSQISLGLIHAFSKRTDASLRYTKINNDANAHYALGDATGTRGTNMKAYGVLVQHKF